MCDTLGVMQESPADRLDWGEGILAELMVFIFFKVTNRTKLIPDVVFKNMHVLMALIARQKNIKKDDLFVINFRHSWSREV